MEAVAAFIGLGGAARGRFAIEDDIEVGAPTMRSTMPGSRSFMQRLALLYMHLEEGEDSVRVRGGLLRLSIR